VEGLAERLNVQLGVEVVVDDEVVGPEPAFSRARGQYDSRQLMAILAERKLTADEVVVGVADVDLYASIFTFVFGEAHLGGAVALVSAHRLRPEHYGLPGDPALVATRLLTESVHEIGHLHGAVHCATPGCVMNFSGVVEEIDLKRPRPCPECAGHFGLESRTDDA